MLARMTCRLRMWLANSPVTFAVTLLRRLVPKDLFVRSVAGMRGKWRPSRLMFGMFVVREMLCWRRSVWRWPVVIR